MSDVPVSVVLDCSATGPPDPAHIEALRQDALAIIDQAMQEPDPGKREALIGKAANVTEQARSALTRSELPTETIVPLTDAEIAQRDLDQAAGLDARKAQRVAEIENVLAWTDRWAARAVEEAVPMTAARIRYRQGLRTLFADIAAATDVAAVEAIKIPRPPANP